MSPQERLQSYKENLAKLLERKHQLQEELEMLEDEIWDARVEVDECEADILNPEYPED